MILFEISQPKNVKIDFEIRTAAAYVNDISYFVYPTANKIAALK